MIHDMKWQSTEHKNMVQPTNKWRLCHLLKSFAQKKSGVQKVQHVLNLS